MIKEIETINILKVQEQVKLNVNNNPLTNKLIIKLK